MRIFKSVYTWVLNKKNKKLREEICKILKYINISFAMNNFFKRMFIDEYLRRSRVIAESLRHRIQQCLNCQLRKLVRLKTRQPMVITDNAISGDKIAMDMVGPLPLTKEGKGYILTLQDQLWNCIAIGLPNGAVIADAFIKFWVCVFGTPQTILTDQGTNFLSGLLKQVAKRFKIQKVKTTAFHPESNGSLESSYTTLWW